MFFILFKQILEGKTKVVVHILTFTYMSQYDLYAYVRDLTTCEVCA
jgi:hypothetical protein